MIPTYPFGRDWREESQTYSTAVGIVMRTRDRPVLLPRALESVVNQTMDDWHLVVVNHGGDPGPVESAVDRIAGAARGKLEVLHLDPAGGMERASNAGLDRLNARYIAVHDDDDTWLPRFLEATVGFLEAPTHARFGAVVTHAMKRWERIEGERIEFVEDDSLNLAETYIDAQRLFGWNRFLPINFLFRSALIDVVGPFNEHLHVIGDWDFHLRVAAVTEIGFIPEVLARYHLRHRGGDTDYDNTITAGEAIHLETDARLRGALLRRYLEDDPSRLGLVVALAHDDEMARRSADRVEEVTRLIDWRTHHTGNRINDMHERIIRMEAAVDAMSSRIDEMQVQTRQIHRPVSALVWPVRVVRRAQARLRGWAGMTDAVSDSQGP